MANALKQGIDYFPLSVDFMDDIKVRKIMRACGGQSIAVLICLLCSCYRFEGYYILWDEDVRFLVADKVGTKESLVQEVVNKALDVGFFDMNMYEDYSILTSYGIQNRFFDAVKRRKSVSYDGRFMLNFQNVNINPNLVDINQDYVYRNQQSRVEESRVEESRAEDKDRASAPALYDRIIDSWNGLGLTSIKSISDDRKTRLDELVEDYGEDSVFEAIKKVGESEFLKGNNDRGWKASFDWLLNLHNYNKVLEDTYKEIFKNKSAKGKKQNFKRREKDGDEIQAYLDKKLLEDLKNRERDMGSL